MSQLAYAWGFVLMRASMCLFRDKPETAHVSCLELSYFSLEGAGRLGSLDSVFSF